MSGKERFVIDAQGNRLAVLLDIHDYHRLVAAREEAELIRAYDEARAANDEAISFRQAVAEIDRSRVKKIQ
ncbi:MAG TPA: hypothetical protein VGO73_13890 [Pyrinomonadaceae bacterium]|jgi:hypothetical protein|nr:hypothetical protein [Pyrinomonadaceae bacterium]